MTRHLTNPYIFEGDLLIEVNGQNFEKLTKDKATTIIQKNTELSLLLKTSLFRELIDIFVSLCNLHQIHIFSFQRDDCNIK